MFGNHKIKNSYDGKPAYLNINSSAASVNQTIEIFDRSSKLPIKNLLANRLLATQSDDDLAHLLLQIQSVSFNPGEVVFQPESVCDFVYFPETAVFSQMNILEDGKTVETAMIGSEGMLGISSVINFQTTNFWTQTLIGGSAFKMNAKVFRQEFLRGGLLQESFLEYLNRYIRQISQRAVCNNHHRIENRFSTWLLMLADRRRCHNLALTQEQIAAVLGVQRPSVTSIAQNLRSRGIIEYIRGRIIINRPKLEAAACECYATDKRTDLNNRIPNK